MEAITAMYDAAAGLQGNPQAKDLYEAALAAADKFAVGIPDEAQSMQELIADQMLDAGKRLITAGDALLRAAHRLDFALSAQAARSAAGSVAQAVRVAGYRVAGVQDSSGYGIPTAAIQRGYGAAAGNALWKPGNKQYMRGGDGQLLVSDCQSDGAGGYT
jgi:hypothetical protein